MSTTPLCPKCGQPLEAGAPQGLCPACLMQGAFPTGTDSGGKSPRFVPPTPAELAPQFPQLDLLEFIGQGGMGAVYQARQKALDRIVALKILPPDIGRDAAFAERFTREARALARLNHPGIVTIHEFGRTDGLFFFVMEFVDGVNLRQLLQGGRLSAREALAIVPQICDALQYAHDLGIVHRDIKPENILLDRRGRVKVADFGLAKIMANDAPLTPSLSPSDGERVAKPGEGAPVLTAAGKVMGTPQYMSPEQIQAPGEVDHRADIYALGVVLYQMLTGELPGKKIEPPSKKVSMDVRLDEIVLRALEKKPELRYQQVSEVKTMVETIAASPVDDNRRDGAPPEKPGFDPRFNPWQPVLAGTGVLGSILLFIIGLVMPFPGNAICLVLAVGGGGVALLKLTGYWPWGSPLFRDSNWTGRNLRKPPSQMPTDRSRLSLTAIAGACWIPFGAYLILFGLVAINGSQSSFWDAFIPAWVSNRMVTLGMLAPIATTILGWLAVAQIRRSAGKLYGLRVAVFDGLLFPLLALDFLVWAALVAMGRILVQEMQWRMGQADLLAFVCSATVCISVFVDVFIIRRVWCAVCRPEAASVPLVEKTARFWRWLAMAGLAVMVLLLVAGAIIFPAISKARFQAQSATEAPPESVTTTVQKAVMTISQCADGDPRVSMALQSLSPLDESKVVMALVPWLESKVPTIRRSALYILFKADLGDVGPAVPSMTKQLGNPEDFTRGMAALALGKNRISATFDQIVSMAGSDTSGYARQCAVYALGLMGDERAIPVLKAAQFDHDSNVSQNAIAALELLVKGKSGTFAPATERAVTDADLTLAKQPPVVVETYPVAGAQNVPAGVVEIRARFSKPMTTEDSWSWCMAWDNSMPKIIGQPHFEADKRTCVLKVKLAAGSTYGIWLNTDRFTGFRDGENRPAIPYLLIFKTTNNAAPQAREDHWRQDLECFRSELPQRHLDFSKLTATNDFNHAVTELEQNIAKISDTEITLGLMRIVAGVGVAHTQLDWQPLAAGFHKYPILTRWCADGLMVLGANPDYRDALGARVVQIGSITPEQLEAAVEPYIAHENTAWLHQQSPTYMSMAELLQHLQITNPDGTVDYSLVKAGGKPFKLHVKPVEWNAQVKDAPTIWDALKITPPLYRRHRDANYWREFIADSKTLYLQYNKCADAPDISFSDFVDEAMACATSNSAARVVVDLRGNAGGNSEVILPLLDGLKNNSKLSARGHLYVLIGGHTFSSGVMDAIYLRDQLHAILIGEPTGGKPNCYGEIERLKLPNSSLTVYYPVKRFRQIPDGDPASLDPDVKIPTASSDILAGRDPVLEAALQHPVF